MTGALAVEVAVGDPGGCPVADASSSTGTVTEVRRASALDAEGRVAEEFAVPRSDEGGDARRPATRGGRSTDGGTVPVTAAPDADATDSPVDGSAAGTPADVERVARYADHDVYRLRREQGPPCVCETVDALGHPVTDISAVDGRLIVGFHAPDVETVRRVVAALRADFGDVSLRTLTRTGEREGEDLVFVDRSRLTERQREVLETAHRLGYFEHPKGANAGEVADALGVSPSTFTEHLAAAQRKILDAVLES
ncbi:MAG: helix-turn-helix domain-containing protein [Halobacteriaceae archaeon]